MLFYVFLFGRIRDIIFWIRDVERRGVYFYFRVGFLRSRYLGEDVRVRILFERGF